VPGVGQKQKNLLNGSVEKGRPGKFSAQEMCEISEKQGLANAFWRCMYLLFATMTFPTVPRKTFYTAPPLARAGFHFTIFQVKIRIWQVKPPGTGKSMDKQGNIS
jgi:hypothetical protein